MDAFGGVEISLTAEEKWEINQNLWNLKVDVEREKERDLENDYYAAQLEGDYDTMEAIENGTYSRALRLVPTLRSLTLTFLRMRTVR